MPFQGTPRNMAELHARMAHRDELAAQLSAVTEQRGQLGQERLNAIARQDAGASSEGKLIAELDQRIRELGIRERKLEKDKISADDAIAAALANGVSVEEHTPAPEPGEPVTVTGSLMPPIDIQTLDATQAMYRRMMAAEAVGFILLGIIGWQIMRRRLERRFARGDANVYPGMEKLQQTVDSIAIEVERVSENQRFVTKLVNEKLQPALGPGAAQPVDIREKERAAVRDGL
jgi:hypothetical protein